MLELDARLSNFGWLSKGLGLVGENGTILGLVGVSTFLFLGMTTYFCGINWDLGACGLLFRIVGPGPVFIVIFKEFCGVIFAGIFGLMCRAGLGYAGVGDVTTECGGGGGLGLMIPGFILPGLVPGWGYISMLSLFSTETISSPKSILSIWQRACKLSASVSFSWIFPI